LVEIPIKNSHIAYTISLHSEVFDILTFELASDWFGQTNGQMIKDFYRAYKPFFEKSE
jgi:hypothetical protein